MSEGSRAIRHRHITHVLDAVDHDVVMLLSTARLRGDGIQRLPNRTDRGREVAALQVETDEQAAFVLTTLDRPGRHFYVDVERKQDLNLLGVAQRSVRLGTVSTIKPNDTTVGSLMATLAHHRGPDHRDRKVTIVGTGNLGFKFALRLAEEGADVALCGRTEDKARLLASAINAILPRFSAPAVTDRPHQTKTDVLIAAAGAPGVVTHEWLDRLSPDALCIDVGIGNFTPQFIEGAHARGLDVCRLDVRAVGDPLPPYPNTFFTTIWGEERFGKFHLVAGGVLGKRGDIVVDRLPGPTALLGVADGQGGVIPDHLLPDDIVARLEQVTSSLLGADDHGGAQRSDRLIDLERRPMDTAPRITVLMATVRFDDLFSRAVASVWASEGVEAHLVLVCDGVTEPVPEEIRTDHRITLVELPQRRGLAAALNAGIAVTDTELIARLDADDLCLPQRLAIQAEYLAGHPDVAVVGATAEIIDLDDRAVGELGRALSPDELENMLPKTNPLIHSSIMFRRSEVVAVGGYNIDCMRMQDYELFLRLALLGRRMAVMGERLIAFRVHQGQHSRSSPPRGPGFATIQRRRNELAEAQGLSARWRAANWGIWIAGQWARHLDIRQPRYMRGINQGPRA